MRVSVVIPSYNRGHTLERREALGNVNAIGTGPDGAWLGAADPRREGTALGP